MSDSPTFSSTNASLSSRSCKDSEIQRVITESDSVLRDIQQELQSLNRLKSKIITELEKAEMNKDNTMNITSLEYTLQTCETQSREFNKQLRRVENRIRANQRRHHVLNGTNRRRNPNERTAMDAKLEENASLLQSLSIVDDTLTMVTDTNAELSKQGVMGSAINKGLGVLQSKFPQANELMVKIKKYRNRDSIVLACVCGVCLLLMFIYWLNK